MTYVSLPKKKGNPGAPVAKSPNVIFIPVDYIEQFPAIPEDSAVLGENITLKADKKAFSVYCTPDSIKVGEKTEGDNDRRGFMNDFEGSHPGSEPEFRTFKKQAINDDFVLLVKNENGWQLIGSDVNPMKLNTEGQDDKDANQTTLKLALSMRGRQPVVEYKGEIPALAPVVEPPVVAPEAQEEGGA